MLKPNQIIGRYRVESVLGRGAMGIVYRGTALSEEIPVAIKTVCAELLVGKESEAIIARFRREAWIGQRLAHPHIVKTHDFDRWEDTLYLVMDYIEGRELGKVLQQAEPLTLGSKISIALQLLDALAYAHGQGIVHRDIKPANILLLAGNSIKLMDFGIAHITSSEMTQLGDLLGSPAYMSPEQLQGEAIDHRTDLFSAGVVLYYLLTGKKPYTGDTLAALMQQVLFTEPPLPSTINPQLPEAFDPPLQRALAKNRDQRFFSANDFAQALRLAVRTVLGEPAPTDEATVVKPRPQETAVGEPTVVVPANTDLAATLKQAAARIAKLLQECIRERATHRRIAEIRTRLAEWFASGERLATLDAAGWTAAREGLLSLCVDDGLTPVLPIILQNSPAPGRSGVDARNDWMGLVSLFALLREAVNRWGEHPTAARLYKQLAAELHSAFLNYTTFLNKNLFGEDNPELMRISADFMRLDVLQMALEELGAKHEIEHVRQTLFMFASQVMGKVNAMVSQFTDTRDALARFSVASLLVEIEELIVLADRLLEQDLDNPVGETYTALLGRQVVTDFIRNARKLAWLVTDELLETLSTTPADGTAAGRLNTEDWLADAALSADQGAVFASKLKQLGLLYLFATRLDDPACRDPLREMSTEVYYLTENLTAAVIANLASGEATATQVATTYAQLSAIAELAESCGWSELKQRVLDALRQQVMPKRKEL